MHKPLARYRIISGISCILLVAAFALFLVVALSLPIIKPIYLFTLQSTVQPDVPTSVARVVRFGAWGLCASSALEENAACIGPQLRYTIPASVVELAGFSPLVVDILQTGLLTVLVLHPIAAAVVFVAAFFSLFLGSHAFAIFVLLLTILAAISSTIVLGVDFALVVTAKDQLKNIGNGSFGLEIVFGNGVWIMLVGCAMVWLAVVLLSARVCYCCGVRRHHHHHHHHDSHHDSY